MTEAELADDFDDDDELFLGSDDDCPECNGSGWAKWDTDPTVVFRCPYCGGTGILGNAP